MRKKIKIGISSCLLGNNVRYDGGNRLDHYILDTFGTIVEWVPICPEVESGMTVPREPMQLVGDPAHPHLITVKSRMDRTDELVRWINITVRELEQSGIRGFILKARSPSCGTRSAELFSISGISVGVTSGLFAGAVLERFTLIPVVDEEVLRDPDTGERFLKQIQNKH